MTGRFITFEGIDGAGKSTHLEHAIEWLRRHGRDVVATREPGGSELAEMIRALLLQQAMSLQTELMLVFAARRDHLEQRILPALERGQWVVCDRFTDSTWAYQGAGRGADRERIAWFESWVQGGLRPDRTYWFDVAPETARMRRTAARPGDRFEREDAAFFSRVRKGYRLRAQSEPTRMVRINAELSMEVIQKLLENDLASLCNR